MLESWGAWTLEEGFHDDWDLGLMPPGPSQAGFCFSTIDQLPPGRKRPLTDLGVTLPAPTTRGRPWRGPDQPHQGRCLPGPLWLSLSGAHPWTEGDAR